MTNGKQNVKRASSSWQEYTLFVTVLSGKLRDHSSRVVDIGVRMVCSSFRAKKERRWMDRNG